MILPNLKFTGCAVYSSGGVCELYFHSDIACPVSLSKLGCKLLSSLTENRENYQAVQNT